MVTTPTWPSRVTHSYHKAGTHSPPHTHLTSLIATNISIDTRRHSNRITSAQVDVTISDCYPRILASNEHRGVTAYLHTPSVRSWHVISPHQVWRTFYLQRELHNKRATTPELFYWLIGKNIHFVTWLLPVSLPISLTVYVRFYDNRR